MWNQYGSILPRSTLLALLLCLGSYEQYCLQLPKVLHTVNVVTWTYSRFYWYICSLLGHCATSGVMCIYKLNSSLPCYNILMYVYMYVCMDVCMDVCMYVCKYACIHAMSCMYACMYVCIYVTGVYKSNQVFTIPFYCSS